MASWINTAPEKMSAQKRKNGRFSHVQVHGDLIYFSDEGTEIHNSAPCSTAHTNQKENRSHFCAPASVPSELCSSQGQRCNTSQRIPRPFSTGLFSLDSYLTAQYLGTKRQIQNKLLKTECEFHLLLCAGLDWGHLQDSSLPPVSLHKSLPLYCSRVVQLFLLAQDKCCICIKGKHLTWFLFLSSCQKN